MLRPPKSTQRGSSAASDVYKRQPNKWFGNVLKDVTVSFIANNPWMLYCEAPFDPELTPSTSTYGQGNDYFMQPSVRSFGFGIKFKL